MTLYDLLRVTACYQKFYVFVINAYDQNIPVGSGIRQELLDEYENEKLFNHLMDKVDMLRISKNENALVVFIRDENFEKRVENLYPEEYTKTWNYREAKTRPFLYFSEIEILT